mmetsp:Transcript_7853/g.25636  ORF Transcript_7853/g.25636 Transcript_7853/m.25636 type:complete len:290 (+) Transcript_7853:158-1027(+)
MWVSGPARLRKVATNQSRRPATLGTRRRRNSNACTAACLSNRLCHRIQVDALPAAPPFGPTVLAPPRRGPLPLPSECPCAASATPVEQTPERRRRTKSEGASAYTAAGSPLFGTRRARRRSTLPSGPRPQTRSPPRHASPRAGRPCPPAATCSPNGQMPRQPCIEARCAPRRRAGRASPRGCTTAWRRPRRDPSAPTRSNRDWPASERSAATSHPPPAGRRRRRRGTARRRRTLRGRLLNRKETQSTNSRGPLHSPERPPRRARTSSKPRWARRRRRPPKACGLPPSGT